MTNNWKSQLNELGWTYSRYCGICVNKKYFFFRDGVELMAVPSRDYYTFSQDGVTKSGKLSQLNQIIASL